jgi:hypothetical protein
MSEFTYLFRGRKMSDSPEEQRQHTEKWFEWFKELRANGQLKNQGLPLEAAGKVVQGSGKVVVKDGPYAEAKDMVGGFITVEARDLDHAAEIAKGCPILAVGGAVEVRPVQIINM